jgi:hypothetical protein
MPQVRSKDAPRAPDEPALEVAQRDATLGVSFLLHAGAVGAVHQGAAAASVIAGSTSPPVEAVPPGALPPAEGKTDQPEDGEDHGHDPKQMDCEAEPEEKKHKE